MRNLPRTRAGLVTLLVLLAIAALYDTWRANDPAGCPLSSAFAEGRSDLVVECEAVVTRLLADDNTGSRHQRFIVELGSGQTLLLSHNIDLAPRIDALQTGDTVRFRGEYEFNDRGGVVHWTHHDPQGRRPGGWIEHRGRRYR